MSHDDAVPDAYDFLVPDENEDLAIGDIYDPLTETFTKPQEDV
jgi:hypothetical protein